MSSLIGSRGMPGATGAVRELANTGYNQVSLDRPEQRELFNQLYGGGLKGTQAGLENLSNLAGGGSEEYWRQLEAPALRQFGELQGNIASRFSGAGMGGRRSSGFHNAMGGAATDLAERLQSNRLGLQNQATQSLLQMMQNLMGADLSDQFLIPKQKKWWEELLPALLGGASQTAGSFGTTGLGRLTGII